MKLVITTLVLAANILLISCKKDRTCSCKTQETDTEVTTLRSNGQSTTTSNSTAGEESTTIAHLKKNDMKEFFDCNDRTEKSTNTYTTVQVVMTQSVVSGFTIMVPTTYTADVVDTRSTDYDCEIK